MTIAFFNSLAAASVGLAPWPIHFLIAGAFKLVSLLSGLYHPNLCHKHNNIWKSLVAMQEHNIFDNFIEPHGILWTPFQLQESMVHDT